MQFTADNRQWNKSLFNRCSIIIIIIIIIIITADVRRASRVV